MNKLRFIKISELRGLIHPIEQYVIDFLDGIEKILDGDSIRYKKDGIFYLYANLNTNDISLSYYLENDFRTKFECSTYELYEIMKYLLEKHFNLTIDRVY